MFSEEACRVSPMNEALENYFASVPADRKPVVDKLHQLIIGLYPEATIDISYKMPTYRVGDRWVALANQKHYVSLYTCGHHHIAEFKQKHPEIKTGKGCINFKPGNELPVEDLKAVVTHAITNPKSI